MGVRHAHHTPSPTGRRRKGSNTWLYMLGGAVVVLAGLGGVLAGLNSERRDIRPASHAPAAFDLPEVSAQAEASIAQAAKVPPPPLSAAPEPLPAKPPMSVVLPLPYDGKAVSRSRPGGPGKVPVVTAKAVRWVRTHKLFAAFLKTPARYLAGKGGRMRSPGAFKDFLADKKQVDAFLDAPLVRVALNSPVISRSLLGDPDVLKAFLGSPAMQDPAAVNALMSSRLLQKVLDCPGPQGALEDGRTLPAVLTNPAVIEWIKDNPSAVKTLAAAAPALAAMNPGVPKKRP
jgi:hypothetical protein